jgi:hypothetical protein
VVVRFGWEGIAKRWVGRFRRGGIGRHREAETRFVRRVVGPGR